MDFAQSRKTTAEPLRLRRPHRYLDLHHAPGTGTPVPGGFTTAQALELVRGLADLNIVGYDVVEVSPPYDPTGITSIAAAGLMQEFISHVAYKKKNGIVF